MTITPYAEQNGVAPTAADQSSKGVARLIQWAEAAEAAHQLAEVLCRTAFCPEQYRDKPGEATAAILAGGEVGLSPFASLNAFDNIQGRAAPKAITLRAIVLSFGHEIELVESTPAKCRMRGRRRGAETWQYVEWGESRARQLGLLNKQQYRTQSPAMYVARATSEICRLVAADAILGIGYAAEELEDLADEQPAKARKVQRQPVQPKAAIAPPTDTAEDDNELLGGGTVMSTSEEPPGEDKPNRFYREPPPVTAEQLKMLGVHWTRLGVKDAGERRSFTSRFVGHDIGTTTKNLTVGEASELIERLIALPDREALEAALRGSEEPELDWPPVTQPPEPT